jgi:hypothetical protein
MWNKSWSPERRGAVEIKGVNEIQIQIPIHGHTAASLTRTFPAQNEAGTGIGGRCVGKAKKNFSPQI